MQPERKWDLELVAMLLAGVLVSLSAGALLSPVLKWAVPDLTPGQEKFYLFLLSTFSFQLVALMLMTSFLHQHEVGWREFLGLSDANLPRVILQGIVVAMVALPVALLLNKLSEELLKLIQSEPAMQPTMQVLQVAVAPGQRLCFAFAAIVLAPLSEEVLFRGVAYKAFVDRGHPRFGLVFSSVLFALIHLSLMTLLPLTFLAMVLALLYRRTGNLMASIVAHSLFNAVNFFMFLYLAK